MPYLVRFEIDDADWRALAASTLRERFTRGNGSPKRKRRTQRRDVRESAAFPAHAAGGQADAGGATAGGVCPFFPGAVRGRRG